MTDVQTAIHSQAPVIIDPFEDGWDCGVDWANVRATDAELAAVKQLHMRGCADLKLLLETLSCDADHLFILTPAVTARHLEGFMDGAVAVYLAGGV